MIKRFSEHLWNPGNKKRRIKPKETENDDTSKDNTPSKIEESPESAGNGSVSSKKEDSPEGAGNGIIITVTQASASSDNVS